jgi:hypothetical protein
MIPGDGPFASTPMGDALHVAPPASSPAAGFRASILIGSGQYYAAVLAFLGALLVP